MDTLETNEDYNFKITTHQCESLVGMLEEQAEKDVGTNLNIL